MRRVEADKTCCEMDWCDCLIGDWIIGKAATELSPFLERSRKIEDLCV